MGEKSQQNICKKEDLHPHNTSSKVINNNGEGETKKQNKTDGLNSWSYLTNVAHKLLTIDGAIFFITAIPVKHSPAVSTHDDVTRSMAFKTIPIMTITDLQKTKEMHDKKQTIKLSFYNKSCYSITNRKCA